MFPALFLGYNNYAEAKENIIKDVNQALAKTVIYKMPTKITADTLYNRQIKKFPTEKQNVSLKHILT